MKERLCACLYANANLQNVDMYMHYSMYWQWYRDLLARQCDYKWNVTLIANYFTDIDECSDGTDSCSQVCTNTNGSFTCGCKNGYQLDTDEVTCNGMYKIYTYI